MATPSDFLYVMRGSRSNQMFYFDSSDVDAVRELLQYGLKETDCDVISCEGDEMARFIAEKVTLRLTSHYNYFTSYVACSLTVGLTKIKKIPTREIMLLNLCFNH